MKPFLEQWTYIHVGSRDGARWLHWWAVVWCSWGGSRDGARWLHWWAVVWCSWGGSRVVLGGCTGGL